MSIGRYAGKTFERSPRFGVPPSAWMSTITMGELSKRLLDDLKAAVRASDATRRDVLRYVRSEIHNAEIERGRSLDDDEFTAIILRQIDQRRESITLFTPGGREDLVEREERQIQVLTSYLPPELSREALLAMAQEVVRELDARTPRDLARVIPALRERVGPRAEPGAIAEAAKEALGAGRRPTGAS